MQFNRGLRQELEKLYGDLRESMGTVVQKVVRVPHLLDEMIDPKRNVYTRADAIEAIQLEVMEFAIAYDILRSQKTLVFSGEQAKVLMDAASTIEVKSLEYKAPFPDFFLQFSEPLPITMPGDEEDALVGICVRQDTIEASMNEEERQALYFHRVHGVRSIEVIPTGVGETVNSIVPIFADHQLRKITWASDHPSEIFEMGKTEDGLGEARERAWGQIKRLVILCIAYINCKNVTLEREGEVASKVNRKRAREGKKLLEPYYTCKLRGVDYGQRPQGGNGGDPRWHHSIRYDVRSHFRRLPNGDTIWISSHQRGLANATYVPKIYAQEQRREA